MRIPYRGIMISSGDWLRGTDASIFHMPVASLLLLLIILLTRSLVSTTSPPGAGVRYIDPILVTYAFTCIVWLTVLVWRIVTRVLRYRSYLYLSPARRFSPNTYLILAAFCALALPLFFAALYSVSGLVWITTSETCRDFNECWYFSYVTWVALGYGDLCPVSLPAKLIAVIQSIIGYSTLGLFIATLVSQLDRSRGGYHSSRTARHTR